MNFTPEIQATYPLSPMQEAMLFHTRYAAETGIYIGQMSCLLKGELHIPSFRQAFETLVQRHTILRTSFKFADTNTSSQVVHRQVSLPFREIDLCSLNEFERLSAVQQFLASDRQLAFELDQPPLMRVHLLRLDARSTQFVWTRHHILMDGWSVNLLMEELLTLYQSAVLGVPAELPNTQPYQVFIDWLKGWDRQAALEFWHQELADFQDPTPILPSEILNRGEVPQSSLMEKRWVIDADRSHQLRTFARSHGLTIATVLTGAWVLLLSRYSNSEDVLFGMAVSCRPPELPGVELSVGLFLNTLPIRIHTSSTSSVGDWLRHLQNHLAEIRQHEHIPLVELHGMTNVAASQSLFSHILVLENYPLGTAEEGALNVGDLEIYDYQFIDQTNFALNVGVIPGQTMTMLMVFDESRLTQPFIDRLGANFQATLQVIVASGSTAKLGHLNVLSPPEHQQLVATLNQTQVTWSEQGFVPDLINRQMLAVPNAVAVSFRDQNLTYRQLSQMMNALVEGLTNWGVQPDTVVGLCLERSLELIITVLAILQAGGAYLPLDPEEPRDRLAFMVNDSGISLILTTAEWVDSFTDLPTNIKAINVAELQASQATASTTPFPAPNILAKKQAAYVLYTSGSTGQPKAVVNTHAGLLNRLLWMQHAYPIQQGDKVLQKTPYTFDVSVWELFWPLMTGATLVLAEPKEHRNPMYLSQVISQQKITIIHFVPSMLRMFLDCPNIEQCDSLRHIFSSGEALPPELRDHVHQCTKARLHNLYGPTEAAIDVTFHDCQTSESSSVVPIGRPIANSQIYLLDHTLAPVPQGVDGELYIGGIGLARGYQQRPDLTAEKFIPDPFSQEPGARLYRTGDIARIDEDGNLIYIGRTDFQVKIRGQRVELGEIEAALRRYPGVQDCAVLAESSELGDVTLSAHIVLTNQTVPEGKAAQSRFEQYRQYLQAQLPEHMIPRQVIFHAAFSLLSNGKLDRRRLRQQGNPVMGERSLEEPRTPVEAKLVAIWQDVLELPKVGIRENFFSLGGHSLLLTQVSLRISKEFGVELPLRDLFNAQTVEAMTEAIMNRQLEENSPEEIAELMAELQNLSPEEIAALLETHS
jgi:amino acid adenylation domain-containing protein